VIVNSFLRVRNAILVMEECVGVQAFVPNVFRQGAVEPTRAALSGDQDLATGAGTEFGVQRIDLHLYFVDRVRVDQETADIGVTAGSAAILADDAVEL